MKSNQLTARKVAAARLPGYYGDGGGLYLQVSKFKTRSWAFRFSFAGSNREMGLGSLETFTLKEARERARACRQQIADGVDPIEARRERTTKAKANAANRVTFEDAAERYIKAHETGWKNPKHRDQWRATLATYAYPVIGSKPVDAIDLTLILKVIEPIWLTRTETASRLRGRIERILAWATVRGYRKGDNPARWKGHLSEMLPAKGSVSKVRHQPALPFVQIPDFMAWLRGVETIAARALEFCILTATRDSETRGAMLTEIDLDARVWEIPAERMKSDRPHRVPLCDRAIEILKELPRDTSGLVFPGARKGKKLSENTLRDLAQKSGRVDALGNLITAHGFRSTFRDWSGDRTAYPRDIIELALAHVVRDKSEAAYRRGDALEKRQALMADWGNYCQAPAPAGAVVPIRGAA